MASPLDIGELRLRVEGSFTGTELRALATKWGLVPEASWDRGTSDLVRGLLKQAEKRYGTTELVRRLKVERPLVEWPEVEDADAEKWGPKSRTQLGLAPPVDEEATVVSQAPPVSARAATEEALPLDGAFDLGALELPASDTVVSDTAVPADAVVADPVVADPVVGAPVVAAPVVADPVVADPVVDASSRAPAQPAPASSAAPRSGPRSAHRPESSPFPGTAPVAAERPREGVDPKLLVLVAGLMLGLAIVAFGAGLLWSRRATAPEGGPKAAASARPNAVAVRAVGVLDSALLGVASRCEVDVQGPPTSEILVSAQEGCGKQTRDARRRALDDASAPLPRDPSRPRPEAAKPNDDPRPVRTPTAGAPQRPSCLSGCAGIKSDCMENCGAEPGDASKFDVWQACSGRCLAAESRCRLSCR